MSTRMSFFRRRSGLSAEDFAHHWKVVHAPIALSIPALERYEQNIVLSRHEPEGSRLATRAIDGICRLRFGDATAMQGVMSPQMVAALKEDEAKFLEDLCTVTLESEVLREPCATACAKVFVYLDLGGCCDEARALHRLDAALADWEAAVCGRIRNRVTARSLNRQPAPREALPIDYIEEISLSEPLSPAAFAAALQAPLTTLGVCASVFTAEVHNPGEPRP